VKLEEENAMDTKEMSYFDRRLMYSMQLAIISRAKAEGLLPYADEVIELENRVRKAYWEETGERL
jgi:hypothetical protein